ncbi:BRO1-like domain protein [Ancylostoma ceylanicum]|uniref:BRO1-like domain protein n=1 Tax=Ancylostoma ceylanicum TaxID=53326 RepID=A0A0D6LNQ7_9BILA|nr:BRO1-like domain protein [Ancylostoma ceylanicum]
MEADISLEKTAILFNYGAVLSQIAASQPLHTDEERKTSAKLFQQSAGIFAHLKEVIQQTSLKQCTTDLQPDTLALLSNLMLAQAQESVYTKAYGDKMNPNALVKIAAQTGDFYTEVNKALGFDTAKAPWKKEWLNITAGKAYGYQAIAQLHQAQLNLQHQEVGERLTRLKHATEQLQAMKRHLPPGCLREQATEIETTYAAALKENKLIDLKVWGNLSVNGAIEGNSVPDLFSSVVPMNILVAVQNYDTMKNERLRMEADKLNEQTELMEGLHFSIVASLGVSDEASSALPESVKRHSSELNPLLSSMRRFLATPINLMLPMKELRLLMPARAHRAAEKNPEATSFLLKMLDKAQEIKCERVEILKLCETVKDDVDKSLKKQKLLMKDVEHYHNLMENLLRLQQKVNDFSFAPSSAIASAPLLPAQPTPQFNATVPGNPYQPYAPYGVPPPQLQMQLPQYSQLAASPPPAPPPYHQTYPPHQGAPSPWHGMGYQH